MNTGFSKENMMETALLYWIAEESPWMQFAVDTQLLGKPSDASAALGDPKIQTVVQRLMDPVFGMPALQTGKVKYTSAGNAFWDLFFLADIGLKTSDVLPPGVADTFLKLQRDDGTFVLTDGTKPSYFCIPSIILSSLVKMGHADDPHILRFIEEILKTQRLDGGWHCAMSRAAGQKLQDTASCPMDTLNVLMLLGQCDRFRNNPSLNGAIGLLLTHWRKRAEAWRPYGFGIGSDFMKLKYPAVKYGILRVMDVLSLYPAAVRTSEYREMLALVMGKSVDGKFFAESASRSYAEFDFGQSKEPSRWITFLVCRLQKRTRDILPV